MTAADTVVQRGGIPRALKTPRRKRGGGERMEGGRATHDKRSTRGLHKAGGSCSAVTTGRARGATRGARERGRSERGERGHFLAGHRRRLHGALLAAGDSDDH